MFTNKHVIVAMLVAPVLSIIAWFAVGKIGGEEAAPALSGVSYPLVEKSSCRYASGVCELANQDVQIALHMDTSAGYILELNASHALTTALVAVSVPDGDPGPRAMQAVDGKGRRWRLTLPDLPTPEERIRLAISIADSAYFADASTLFLQAGE